MAQSLASLSMIKEQKQNTSTWLALKNRVFVGLWIASLVSGCCVSAHDTAATWLMNSLGASPLLLSMMATSASLPFFLFTLPAGAICDLVNRQNLFIGTYLWLSAAAGLLAVCTWLHLVHPSIILMTVFLLGIGFAFNAPVWAAIIPDVVRKEELASAITLGGVQMNMGGIVGPAIGGFLLPIAGPTMLFSLNALAFLFAALTISRCYREQRQPQPHLENLLESLASAARYVRYTPGMQVISDPGPIVRILYCGGASIDAGGGLSTFASGSESARSSVHQLGDRVPSRSDFGPALCSEEGDPEQLDDSGQCHSDRCLRLHGRRAKSLDFSSRGRLGRHQLDGFGVGTLDCRPTGDARLGARTDERRPHGSVSRGGGPGRYSLGLVSDCLSGWAIP